ncbi:MAG: pitrilysin family protein [Gemmatimonadetes bacterium]|nr:pitrilysin family protein [Gemmatimonadota bacterium]
MIDIEEHVLDNGLKVVLAPDRTTPVVGVNLWYGVGSRNEPSGRTGFAHLFEHLMFQGSAHVPRNGHFHFIERVGGSANATTWFDRTNYYETVPSHHLDLALWLESDRMGWMLPAMTGEKLENQRQVVMNERRQRYDNQPYGDWDERIQSLLFPATHPYHHTVIGSMEDIAAASLPDVRNFFATYYVPNNAVLSICGDCDPDEAVERARHYFDPIGPGPEPPSIPGTARIPFATGGTLRADVRAAVPLPKVYMASRVPPFTADAFYAGEVVSYCLGRGRSSRLYDRVVRNLEAESATCHLLPLTTGAAIFLVIATGFPHTDVDELERSVVREIEGIGDLTEEEAARAIIGSETSTLRQLQRVETRADLLSMYATHFGDATRLERDLRRLRSVTVREARDWGRSYLHGENRVSVRYIPEESS